MLPAPSGPAISKRSAMRTPGLSVTIRSPQRRGGRDRRALIVEDGEPQRLQALAARTSWRCPGRRRNAVSHWERGRFYLKPRELRLVIVRLSVMRRFDTLARDVGDAAGRFAESGVAKDRY